MHVTMSRVPALLALSCFLSESVSLSLKYKGGLINSRLSDMKNRDHLLVHIDQLMQDGKISFADIDGLVWVHGPGQFMALRISAAIIQSLSFAWRLPVYGVSTLRVMAVHAFSMNPMVDQVLAVLPAGRQRIHIGFYSLDESGRVVAVQDDACMALDALCLPEDASGSCFVVGDAWDTCSDQIEQAYGALSIVGRCSFPFFAARFALECAEEECLIGCQWERSEQVVPHYLHNQVVRP